MESVQTDAYLEVDEQQSIFVSNLPHDISDNDPFWKNFSNQGPYSKEGFKFKKEVLENNRVQSTVIISYTNEADANKALDLNGITLRGRAVRVYPFRRPQENQEEANIFVSQLAATITEADLNKYFSRFGKVFSVKIKVDSKGLSKGYGYVQFESKEQAQTVINTNTTHVINLQEFHVEKFIPLYKRDVPEKQNLQIKGLPASKSLTEVQEAIKQVFTKYGEIESALVTKEQNTNSVIAYVCYKNAESAQTALKELNDSTKLFEDSDQIQVQLEVPRNQQIINHESNLFTKNLKAAVSEADIKKTYEQYGQITSIKLEKPSSNNSFFKGTQFAMINFSSKNQALSALKDAIKDNDVRKLYQDSVVFLTPHVSQKERNIVKSQTSTFTGGNIPSLITIPSNIVPTQDNFYNNSSINYPNHFHNTFSGYPNPFANPYVGYPGYYNYPYQQQQQQYNYGINYGYNPNYNNNNNFRNNANYTQKKGNYRFNNNNNRNNYGGPQETNAPYQPKNNFNNSATTNYSNYQLKELNDLKKKAESADGREEVRIQFGTDLMGKIKSIAGEDKAPQVTGMLIDLNVFSIQEIYEMTLNQNQLIQRTHEALDLINAPKTE